MAKKRKASSRSNNVSDGSNLDAGGSRKRIRTFEDVADSDDEFHLQRDRILLDEEPEAKRRRKWQEQEEFLQPSDEEVLEYSEPESEDVPGDVGTYDTRNGIDSASEDDQQDGEGDEADGLGWGVGKDDIYGADEIETEEQALEEEAEALRLQKKHLQSMAPADYGFDEEGWRDGGTVEKHDKQEPDDIVTEVLPQLEIREDAGPAERLKILKSRYPEFEPLSRELLLVEEYRAMLESEQQLRSERTNSANTAPNLMAKLRATSAYAGALIMYFTLLSSPASKGSSGVTAISATKLRDHPVMDALVKCRVLWQRVKNLPNDPAPMLEEDAVAVKDTERHDVENKAQEIMRAPVKKSRAQRHAEAAQTAAEARRAERMQRVEADLADLDSLIGPAVKRGVSQPNAVSNRVKADNSDDGEEAPLTAQDAAEKAQRKKSLRFYTSQIAQKANKRGAAGRNAGGDDDIPYRERLKDRQARLNAEAEKRGKRNIDASAELGGSSDDEDDRQAQQVRADADGDEYYNLIASRTAQKKADKASLAEAQKQAALSNGRVVQEETVGADGKRKITYAIEKNKGLTPRRKKEVRNPRVKKRKKFDEKKKKLGSIKPVYKGGEGRGGYGGEMTGIKTGLVKSVKL